MAQHPAAPLPDPGNSFTERHAGWIFSICLHVVVFAWVAQLPVEQFIAEMRPTRRLTIKLAPPPAPVEEVVEQPIEIPVAPQPVQELAIDEPLPDAAPMLTEQTGTKAIAEANEQSEAPVLDPVAQQAADRMAERAERMRQINRIQGNQGSAAVETRLRLEQSEQVAEKTLFSGDGLHEGAVRDLKLDGVPPEAVETVMQKYGFRILAGNINEATGEGFLDRVSTDVGEFRRVAPNGNFQIFSYGQAAEARMAQLEEAAIRERGHDPRYTRVVFTLFGVVSTKAGWDLGIRQIRIEPVPGAPQRGPAQERPKESQ